MNLGNFKQVAESTIWGVAPDKMRDTQIITRGIIVKFEDECSGAVPEGCMCRIAETTAL